MVFGNILFEPLPINQAGFFWFAFLIEVWIESIFKGLEDGFWQFSC
jgi:hypothetical protein